MSDLIKRSDAIKALYKYSFVSKDVIEKEINAIPSADRPQGEWIEVEEDWRHQIEFWKCSECEFATLSMFNYCPNCGSKMRGEHDD